MIKNFNLKIIYIIILNISLFQSCALINNQDKKETAEKKAQIYYTHGTDHLINKKYTDALNNLLTAYKLTPENSQICNNLGMAYYFKKNYQKAKKFLKQAIKYDSTNMDAKNNLASIYYKEQKYNLAKNIYEEVQKDLTYNKQFRVSLNLAVIYLKENNKKFAKKLLHESLKENREYCSAHYMLGKLEKSELHLQKAYEHFQDARLGSCTSNPAPLYEQAQILLELNNTSKAILKLETLIEKHSRTEYGKWAKLKLSKLQNKTGSIKQGVSIPKKINKDNGIYRAPAF